MTSAGGIKVGVVLPTDLRPSERGHTAQFARMAEDLGFSDIWIPDHVVFPTMMVDSMITAGICAASTATINIGFGVLQVGIRHPVAIGRSISSLASEADGRVILGLGLGGDHEPEWRALEVDVKERAARFEEAFPAIIELANGRPYRAEGKYFNFDVPALRPSGDAPVPIWIGARKAQAVRRAALADGWLGMYRAPSDFATDIVEVREAAARLGRPPPMAGMSLLVSVVGSDAEAKEVGARRLNKAYGVPLETGRRWAIGGVGELKELIHQYQEVGATHISLGTMDSPADSWPVIASALL